MQWTAATAAPPGSGRRERAVAVRTGAERADRLRSGRGSSRAWSRAPGRPQSRACRGTIAQLQDARGPSEPDGHEHEHVVAKISGCTRSESHSQRRASGS